MVFAGSSASEWRDQREPGWCEGCEDEHGRDADWDDDDCGDEGWGRDRGRSPTYGREGHRIPPDHLPPPAECRVWYPDRPAGHQPPPTDCGSARREACRTGGRLVYGGGDGRHD